MAIVVRECMCWIQSHCALIWEGNLLITANAAFYSLEIFSDELIWCHTLSWSFCNIRTVLLFCCKRLITFSHQESKSFAVNMFKGQISTSQVFPFPSGEQRPMLKYFFNALLWYGPVLFYNITGCYILKTVEVDFRLIFVFKCYSIGFCCSVVRHYPHTSVLLSVCLLYLFPEYFLHTLM